MWKFDDMLSWIAFFLTSTILVFYSATWKFFIIKIIGQHYYYYTYFTCHSEIFTCFVLILVLNCFVFANFIFTYNVFIPLVSDNFFLVRSVLNWFFFVHNKSTAWKSLSRISKYFQKDSFWFYFSNFSVNASAVDHDLVSWSYHRLYLTLSA